MEPVGKVMDTDVSCREKLFRCFLRSRCNEGWEEGGTRRFFVSVVAGFSKKRREER